MFEALGSKLQDILDRVGRERQLTEPQVIGMFNMTNRVSSALGFTPNAEYHEQARSAPDQEPS
ncbi:hypothetical protein CTI14_51555 [Methylobacterium radiotolerans]|nr:hypothetical protein CTI14_51555 [Methylobacterium radiotolerans]